VGFGQLLDQVSQLTAAPIFDAMHFATASGDHGFVAFQHGRDLLALIRMDQQDDWGRRQLAYLIQKLAKAHYLCINIEASQAVMDEIEHAFKFNDAVLRHMTVVKKKAETGPSLMMRNVEREEARKAQQQEYAA